MSFYERLNTIDAAFLAIDEPSYPMVLGGIEFFDRQGACVRQGRLDPQLLRQAIGTRLHLIPRLRQKIIYVPYQGIPVWVDDHHFEIRHHVRTARLSNGTDEAELLVLLGELAAAPLDHARPLWEMWFIDRGADADTFVVLMKAHHCMVDAVSALSIFSLFLDKSPKPQTMRAVPWTPRPHPTGSDLGVGEITRRLRRTVDAGRWLFRSLQDAESLVRQIQERFKALSEAAQPVLSRSSGGPLNVPVGPNRRLEWFEVPLPRLMKLKHAFEVRAYDLLLAIASEGFRRFFSSRGVTMDEIEIRALVPLSIRTPQNPSALGNSLTEVVAPLFLEIKDPIARLHAIARKMHKLRRARPELAAEIIDAIGDWTLPSLLAQGSRFARDLGSFNTIVSNIHGPTDTLYLRGHRLLRVYPIVPLSRGLSLTVGVISYKNMLGWGINADREAFPDLDVLATELQNSVAVFETLSNRSGPRRARKKKAVSLPDRLSNHGGSRRGPSSP